MKTGKAHHLVLDDDPAIAQIIERATEVPSVPFQTLSTLLPSLGRLKPLACFVDIHLGNDGPGESGLEVIPILRRQWPQTPILVMTSDSTAEAIEGALAAGADDFLRKPIHSKELRARLQARLEEKARLHVRETLRIGDLSLNVAHQSLSAQGRTIYLSPTATNLLTCLIEQKGISVKRELLKRKVWGRLSLSDNALDRKVYEVRKAIEELGSSVQIECIYGEGYKLAAETKTASAPTTSLRPRLPERPIPAKIQVLLVEDRPADAVLVREALRKGDGVNTFDLKRGETLKEGLDILAKGGIDIVLLDLTLPDSTGVETFRRFVEQDPNVPIVVLSGVSDEKLANETVTMGAQDFLPKGEIGAISLAKTIRYALSRFQVGVLEKSALREKQSQLEKLSELKSQFLANMSHEIRTPMNAIIGMTSLLHQTKLNADQTECVSIIRSASETLLHVINDILDFSKIQSGKVELEKTEFDLRNLVEEAIDLLGMSACEKNLPLFTSLDPQLPSRVVGDPTRLRQVLVNLVGNAVKFTAEGAVTIRVSQTPDGSTLRFEIKDTGEGIREEEKPRLFEVFNQANLSTTKRFGGTGLGLAISKQLVELMKGKIGFESTFGVGTTFSFEIPLQVGVNKGFAPRPVLTDKHLAVYCEDPLQSAFLCDQLQRRGMKTTKLESEAALLTQLGAQSGSDLTLIGCSSEKVAADLLEKTGGVTPGSALLWIVAKSMVPSPRWEGKNVLGVPYRQSKLYEVVANLLGYPSENASPEVSTQKVPPILLQLPLLVAEDNQINQRVIRRLLEKLSISADFVANGIEAVIAAESGKYAAILMDCSMPEMDGWTASLKLREQGNELPIIAMTANAFKEDRDRCLACGMNEYLAKPIRLEDLENVFHLLWPEKEGATTSRVRSGPKKPAGPLQLLNLQRVRDVNSLDADEDDEFIRELMQLFRETAPETFTNIIRVLAEGDCARIKSQSHRLKGLALNLGAERLADVCARLEAFGADSQVTLAREMESSLNAEWKDLLAALSEQLAT